MVNQGPLPFNTASFIFMVIKKVYYRVFDPRNNL